MIKNRKTSKIGPPAQNYGFQDIRNDPRTYSCSNDVTFCCENFQKLNFGNSRVCSVLITRGIEDLIFCEQHIGGVGCRFQTRDYSVRGR